MSIIRIRTDQTNDVTVGMGLGDEFGYDLGLPVKILRIVWVSLINQEFGAITGIRLDDIIGPINKTQNFACGKLKPGDLGSLEGARNVARAHDIDFFGRGVDLISRELPVGNQREIDHHLDIISY